MERLCEYSTSHNDNFLFKGDLNFDLINKDKSKALRDLMDLFDLDNIIGEPTFVSRHGSFMIDVALTNSRNKFHKSFVIDTGASDGHFMISMILKSKMPRALPKQVKYRSFRHFNG